MTHSGRFTQRARSRFVAERGKRKRSPETSTSPHVRLTASPRRVPLCSIVTNKNRHLLPSASRIASVRAQRSAASAPWYLQKPYAIERECAACGLQQRVRIGDRGPVACGRCGAAIVG
jgi:hypothetical protein